MYFWEISDESGDDKSPDTQEPAEKQKGRSDVIFDGASMFPEEDPLVETVAITSSV